MMQKEHRKTCHDELGDQNNETQILSMETSGEGNESGQGSRMVNAIDRLIHGQMNKSTPKIRELSKPLDCSTPNRTGSGPSPFTNAWPDIEEFDCPIHAPPAGRNKQRQLNDLYPALPAALAQPNLRPKTPYIPRYPLSGK